MRIEITKAAAAAIILAKLDEGAVTGGAYYLEASRLEDTSHREGAKAGNRCAIGWLFSEEQAKELEGASEDGAANYMLASALTNAEWLVTDDDEWFHTAQHIADHTYDLPELNAKLGDHCRSALVRPGPHNH